MSGPAPGLSRTEEQALLSADPVILSVALAHTTNDPSWLAYGRDTRDVGPDLLARAVRVLEKVRRNALAEPCQPSDSLLRELYAAVAGQDADGGQLARLRSDLGIDRAPDPVLGPGHRRRPTVTVIGAGLSGLCMASKLTRAGFDVAVLERSGGLGGVWFDNSYPGCGVDTHPFEYELAAHRAGQWSNAFPSRDEILRYVESIADQEGLRDLVHLNTRVTGAEWDAGAAQWVLEIAALDGGRRQIRTDVLISAVGSLNQPKPAGIAELDQFEGAVFHTSAWEHDVPLAGRRIGLIGNGSSGIQVARHLADLGHLTVFQRSAAWIAPRSTGRANGEIDEMGRWLCRNVPHYEEWLRVTLSWELGDKNYGRLVVDQSWRGPHGINESNERLRCELVEYIRSELGARTDLLDRVVPDYPPYVKRMVMDNAYYRTLARPGVRLVTEPIQRATATGLMTLDGGHHDLDVLVLANGFRGTQFLWPLELRGRSGRTPAEIAGRDDEARAYLGIAMPEFPNFFSLHGPNSGAGHGGSASFVADCQSHYILRCLLAMVEAGARTVECAVEAFDEYNTRLDEGLRRMVWSHDGVESRFRSRSGRVVVNHPWTWHDYWTMTRAPAPGVLRLGGH
ncbi:flavin-containing monooxygenase [Nocardia sp. NBC_01329]|uniref:flavin-containing monooxygenase n=1 Tax=Nocardia sp. NBC_01329 TaxID=2903594 RepID=UPI002E150A29|nr:NAD(P)-binding protein [Nocardia sp. NBC_01329]